MSSNDSLHASLGHEARPSDATRGAAPPADTSDGRPRPSSIARATSTAASLHSPHSPYSPRSPRFRHLAAALRRASGWLLIAALLAAWQRAALTVPGLAEVLPPVDDVVRRTVGALQQGTVLLQLGHTLHWMFAGYLIGCALGITIGMATGRSRFAHDLLEPLLELTRPVPIAAVVPLLMLFLGIDAGLKVGAVAIASFFPVFANAYAAFRSTPRTLDETARSFGLTPWQTLVQVALPHAVPTVLVGMRLALSVSLVVTVFVEMIAGNSGIGYFILNSQQNMAIVDLYVGVLLLAATGYVLNRGFLLVERRLIPWHISQRRRV
ncbi:ABC transporter permease [Chitinasiproducens palmae]|uniref:Sulfonate transport system permease protein n=1 Tax=Chitinasiproducens palmae TaxID=1770053 RepID=A0A1H2PQ04_9BURK|nr:ABC transporter permease [Chitinasiproducens palmae]SDV48868.1 sulfonate transport system permease protein [Chitinasiproducens palmae]